VTNARKDWRADRRLGRDSGGGRIIPIGNTMVESIVMAIGRASLDEREGTALTDRQADETRRNLHTRRCARTFRKTVSRPAGWTDGRTDGQPIIRPVSGSDRLVSLTMHAAGVSPSVRTLRCVPIGNTSTTFGLLNCCSLVKRAASVALPPSPQRLQLADGSIGSDGRRCSHQQRDRNGGVLVRRATFPP